MGLQFPPWQIAALFPFMTETIVTVGNTATVLLKADSKRQFCAFFAVNQSSQVYVSTNASINAASGINVANSQFGIVMHIDDWGPFVTAPWFGWSSIGNVNISVFSYSALEWPKGLTPDVVMPYEQDDVDVANMKQQTEQRASRTLRAVLKKFGMAIPAWLGQNGDDNGYQPAE